MGLHATTGDRAMGRYAGRILKGEKPADIARAPTLAKQQRGPVQRTREALRAAKKKSFKLGGTTAKSIANHEEAMQRAEALRPIFAGMSHRKMAEELNAFGVPTLAGGRSDRRKSMTPTGFHHGLAYRSLLSAE
jgi:hypothetical protein